MTAGRGRFIAFEGGEGSGKTSQARRLAGALDATCTYEPGDTDVGRLIRGLLLDPATAGLDWKTEALLMAADRAQHVAEVVEPALAVGTSVVTDRYIGSSLAYQGFGRGLDVEQVRRISEWATAGLWPDLVLLLDVPVDVAATRLGAKLDRFEAEGRDFHERIRSGFRSIAAADPDRWVVIDGTASEDDVAGAIWWAVHERLGIEL